MLSDLSGYSKKGFNSSHTILKLFTVMLVILTVERQLVTFYISLCKIKYLYLISAFAFKQIIPDKMFFCFL